MTTVALSVWFALYALTNLLETRLPSWVLGVAAVLVLIALVASGGWKNKTSCLLAAAFVLFMPFFNEVVFFQPRPDNLDRDAR